MPHSRVIQLIYTMVLLIMLISLSGCLVPGPEDDYQAAHPDGPHHARDPFDPNNPGFLPQPNLPP